VRLLELLARRRTVVLWIDDAQWGADALAFVIHLLRRRFARPLLAVLTIREDLLADAPQAEALLGDLVARADDPDIDLPVGPLDGPAHRALIGGLLGLEDRALATIEARTAGNPLFAVELIESWAQRGALTPTAGGYAVDPTAARAIPEDLADVWASRLDRALAGHAPEAARAVALLAVLGPTVAPDLWDRACRAAGLPPRRALVDTLRRQRLLTVDREGWRLVHGMLREAIEARARDARWWTDLHAAAAAALGADAPAERLGHHLLEAGRPADALPHLLRAAREAIAVGDHRSADAAFHHAEAALAAIGRPMPPERAILGLLRAWSALRRGAYDEAVAVGEPTFAAADDPEIALSVAVVLARVLRLAGDPDDAARWLLRASALRRRVENPWFHLMVDVAEGIHHSRAGALGLAATALVRGRTAAAAAARWPRPVWYRVSPASLHENLAAIARQRGDLPGLLEHLRNARAAHAESGEWLGDVASAILLGEAHRMRGETSEAIAVFRAAWRRLEAIGSPQHTVPWINLVILHVLDDRTEGARGLLVELIPELERSGQTALLGLARLCRCAVHAADAAWDAFDVDLATSTDELRASGFVDVDVARVADRVAELAFAADERLRGSVARAIATEQRRRLR
jgi:tetratricopeptide (TPR) repeat protein